MPTDSHERTQWTFHQRGVLELTQYVAWISIIPQIALLQGSHAGLTKSYTHYPRFAEHINYLTLPILVKNQMNRIDFMVKKTYFQRDHSLIDGAMR